MNDPIHTFDDLRRAAPAVLADATLPHRIGRFRIERVLGQGGFGLVYLAHDEQLSRPVAIKVPHARLVAGAGDAEAYLTEARTVANLDHPNIVAVFDVGATEEFPCYIVSKYIDGSNLKTKAQTSRLSLEEYAELVATVAEALHYAHKQGIVHRDIKPGNILLDKSGKPFVADFGLALREQDVGKGPRFVGTPAYMSPEQARGEGHRVDGRSDIFSLGVVLYELLTGRRPFQTDSQDELLEQIASLEVRPPRQIDDGIPKELERICLKALSKRASERYSTARDLSDDLRHFLAGASVEERSTFTAREKSEADAATPMPSPVPSPTPQQAVKIVPKGLRSFDAGDADFFLELLPGPRDRDGLPDNIRFWKSRIEEADPDNTFSVGLLYGPSGCGKSSLVKAGLLPRLPDAVIAVYVEATPAETETRVLNGLRKKCPALPVTLGLKETLAALRRGHGVPCGKKVLIVLDQFEQWLHGKREEQNTELVQALRQCDGGRVRCLFMVRDDFWMAATRFMRELEIRLLEGQNSAAVDLFDLDHARSVLAAFGRSFGKIPEKPAETSKEQKQFLEQAVLGLAQEGKIICVRLALFAEMMKGKAWTPAALKEMGGMKGVGVTFLEDSFSATTAPPEHRYHQKAARNVLKALLPESGTDIKGSMRSYAELLEESGYRNRPRDFDDLIRILDSEVRLITPTELEAEEGADDRAREAEPGQKYYQLAHDYLVHSVRDWLTRKQKETRRGRAELLLADRAAVWNARVENRQLPSLWQWISIRWLTEQKNWTPSQRKMMRKATGYYALRGVTTLLVMMLLGWAGYEGVGSARSQALVESITTSETVDVLRLVERLHGYRRWANRRLFQHLQNSSEDSKERLHASLALVPVDKGQVEFLYGRLLKAESQELRVIREALFAHKQDLTERLWTLLENPKNDQDQRFRASCALATFAPDDPRWEKAGPDVAAMLVTQKPFVIAQWADSLKGVGHWLIPSLADFLADEKRNVAERGLIATVYGTYAAGTSDAYTQLEKRLAEQSEPIASEEAKVGLAKRQASIGVALVVMDRGANIWPLLTYRPDPTLRSFLIERFGAGGVDPKLLTARLDKEKDVSVKRAILLSLGEFGLDRLSQAERQNHLPRLLQLYRDDPDPGIHSSSEWLLRQWQAADKLREIEKQLATGKFEGKRQWYINKQGQTMMLVSRPGEFWMGEGPQRHRRQIGRSFTIASKEVTVEQFRQFRKENQFFEAYAPTTHCPVLNVSWYEAAEYCNWLSEREEIRKEQWCYLPNKADKYTEGMKMAPNYLQRTGYRLPTETEWEYACRAGAETDFCFGQTNELLGKYGWYLGNSLAKSHPTGSLKPNDLGLFDMHGNAWEWTQDAYREYGKALGDNKDTEYIDTKIGHVMRGGSFLDHAVYVRSANRVGKAPANGYSNAGFRAARTFTAE